jgi:hypothetical protein
MAHQTTEMGKLFVFPRTRRSRSGILARVNLQAKPVSKTAPPLPVCFSVLSDRGSPWGSARCP